MSSDQRLWGRGWYFEKIAVDPINADIIFVPNVAVHESKDGGKTFATFAVRGSPGGDDYHQLWISPANPDVMIVASDQGAVVTLKLVHVSMNDGAAWKDVTPPGVGAWSRVTMIEASHSDFNEAYATVDRHQLNDFAPHIYRTRDLGKTWQEITRGLPAEGYVHTIKEDPARRGFLVAGTERAVFASFDDGDSWQSLQLNLPATSMRDVEFHDNDLIVATHGRGFWVIDDISVLNQAASATTPAMLYKPAAAIAVIQGGDNGTPWQKDEPQAENAPAGAVLDYYLRSAATGAVKIEVVDAAGQVVRTVDRLRPLHQRRTLHAIEHDVVAHAGGDVHPDQCVATAVLRIRKAAEVTAATV